jgi:hypothetical protein
VQDLERDICVLDQIEIGSKRALLGHRHGQQVVYTEGRDGTRAASSS